MSGAGNSARGRPEIALKNCVILHKIDIKKNAPKSRISCGLYESRGSLSKNCAKNCARVHIVVFVEEMLLKLRDIAKIGKITQKLHEIVGNCAAQPPGC